MTNNRHDTLLHYRNWIRLPYPVDSHYEMHLKIDNTYSRFCRKVFTLQTVNINTPVTASINLKFDGVINQSKDLEAENIVYE